MKSIVCRGASALSILALLVAACSSEGPGDEVGPTASIAQAIVSLDRAVTATISFNDWGSGYTGTITLVNNGNTPTTSWSVVANLRGSTMSQVWSANTQVS